MKNNFRFLCWQVKYTFLFAYGTAKKWKKNIQTRIPWFSAYALHRIYSIGRLWGMSRSTLESAFLLLLRIWGTYFSEGIW